MAMISSKITPDPKENLAHFDHLAHRKEQTVHLAWEPVCAAAYMVLYASWFSTQTELVKAHRSKSDPQTGEATEGWNELRGALDLGVGRFSCMDSWMDGYMDVKGEECMDG